MLSRIRNIAILMFILFKKKLKSVCLKSWNMWIFKQHYFRIKWKILYFNFSSNIFLYCSFLYCRYDFWVSIFVIVKSSLCMDLCLHSAHILGTSQYTWGGGSYNLWLLPHSAPLPIYLNSGVLNYYTQLRDVNAKIQMISGWY